MRNIEQTSAELFDKLRNRFSPIETRDENRKQVLNPKEARFFSFDYYSDGENFGPITISLLDRSLKIFYAKDLDALMSKPQKRKWFKFLKDLRFFAMPEVKDFDVRDISKSGLNLNDLKYLNKDAEVVTKKEVNVSEAKLYGTKRTSYQKMESVRIIARHSKPIVDETVPGARSRNIESFYIENSQGERFKLPEGTTINGARAYARHVKNGGQLHDDFSRHIGRVIKEMSDLRMFVRNMRGRTFEDIETQQMVESAIDHYGKLHSDLHLIRSQRGYEQYRALWQPDVLEESDFDLTELRERFVRKVFDDRITDALPVVFREYRRRKMATEQEFESWANNLVREFEEKNPTDQHNKKASKEQQDIEEEDSSEINVKSPFANSARNQQKDSVDNIIDDGDENQSLAGLFNEKGFEFRFSDGVYYFESKDEIERAKDWISYKFPKIKFPKMGVFDYGYGVYGSDTFDRELPGGKGVMESVNENLRKWFQQDWVRFGPDGKIRGQCARDDDKEGKPKCLPRSKAHALGKKGRATAARRKRRLDPNPERKGVAINVKTKEAVEFNVYLNELLKESIQYPLPSDIDRIPELPNYDEIDPVADSRDIYDFTDSEEQEGDEIKEAIGDLNFDAMMANIVKGTAARKDIDTLKAQPSKASPEATLGKFGMELITQLEKLCKARCGPDRTMQDKSDIEPKLTAMANSNDGGEKVANVLLDLFKIDSGALKEFARAFNQHGDWPWQNFATAWTQGEWNDYKRQWTDGYLGSLGQGVAEGIENTIDSMSIEELEQFVDEILPILQQLSKQKSKTAKDQFNQLKKQYDAALEKIYDVDSMNESTLQEKFKSKQGGAEGNEQEYRVTYDIYGSNREKPLNTNTRTVRASSEEEAIKIIRDLIGGRNHRIEKSVAEADPLRARGGIEAVTRMPRAGQTDFRSIAAGNHPESGRKFSNKDRKELPGLLKAKIKSSLGKHTKPNLPEQGVAEGTLREFAPGGGDDGDDGFSEETLKMLAAQWYNGDEDPKVEQTLAAAGWEIGYDEGYDDEPGVFVVQSGDVNGNSYISWPAHELKQGVAEGKQSCPECGGALVEFSQLNEKKDACYYKVKATAKVWPSAYASGRLVQCRKKGAKNWGKKNESTQPSVNKLLNSFKSDLDKL